MQEVQLPPIVFIEDISQVGFGAAFLRIQVCRHKLSYLQWKRGRRFQSNNQAVKHFSVKRVLKPVGVTFGIGWCHGQGVVEKVNQNGLTLSQEPAEIHAVAGQGDIVDEWPSGNLLGSGLVQSSWRNIHNFLIIENISDNQ